MASYRIYLVDDDRFLLDMYAVKFKTAGHEIETFQSGEDVLTALREKPAPDAILLDVIMPGLSGFEVLDAIRKEKLGEQMKAIMLTNQGQDTDLDRAKELHASVYIIKASAIPSEVLSETISIIEKKA